MARNEKPKKFKRLKVIFLLVYIAFLLSIILNNGLSKFRRTFANETSMQIAKIVVNTVYDTPTTIENLHNEEVEWGFKVVNYNGDKLTTTDINEINGNYRLQVDLGTLTNLQYKLYKIVNETKTELQLVQGITVNQYPLQNRTIQEDEYCIEIKTTDNVNQSALQGTVKINVIAEQSIN